MLAGTSQAGVNDYDSERDSELYSGAWQARTYPSRAVPRRAVPCHAFTSALIWDNWAGSRARRVKKKSPLSRRGPCHGLVKQLLTFQK